MNATEQSATLAVGYYRPTDAFRGIAEHVCVFREDQEGGGTPVAICGPAGDPASEAEARKFAATDDMLVALRDLIDGIWSRQRAHDCPGFDCATCTPHAEIAAAEEIITRATGC